MRKILLASFAALALPGAALADSYAAACAARKGVPVSECTCEGQIAASVLDKTQLQAAVLALRGKQARFKAMIAKMGPVGAEAFSGKMDEVGRRTEAACPQ